MLDVGWICELGPWLFLQTPDLSNLHNSYEQDQARHVLCFCFEVWSLINGYLFPFETTTHLIYIMISSFCNMYFAHMKHLLKGKDEYTETKHT